MASDEGEDTTKVRKRNRRVASCNPCRAKRSRCDRGRPCSACIKRGSQSSCTWDATALQPVYERREANQTEALRNEVDRLQRLVDVLVSAQPPPNLSTPSPLLNPSTSSYLAHIPPSASISLDTSTSAPSTVSGDAPLTVDELETDDIVEKLSELTIKTFQLPSHEGERSSTHALVEEAQNLLDAAAPFPSDSAASPAVPSYAGVFAAPLTRDGLTLEEIARRVPPKEMVDEAVEAYFDGLAFYLHPITRKQLDHHLQLVFPSPSSSSSSSAPAQPAPALSLAIVLGITSLGLFSGDGTSTCYSTYSRSSLPAQMIELARNALALSETVEGPSLDSIRALLIVGGHYIAGGSGDEGRKGVSTVSLAANACLQLGLHRDPDSKLNTLSFAEKEDRRRLYHLVLHEEAVLARLLGRRFVLLHSNHSDTRLPLDIHDDELEKEGPPADQEADRAAEEETLMSAVLVRMKLAQLSRRITEEIFSVHPAGYTRVLELDIKIRQLQNDMPLRYQAGGAEDSPLAQLKAAGIQLMYLQEILRLHRPYALHSLRCGEEVDKYAFSRKVCIETALLVLERHNPPDLQACIPCMLHCLILAATVLSVDLMYDLENPDGQRRKELVRAVIPRLERFKAISTVCRRGIALLTFLLDKLDAVSRSFRPSDEDSPFFKRNRPDVGVAWSTHSIDALPPPPPDLARKLPSRSSSLPSFPTAAEQPLPPPSHRGLSLPFSSTPRTIRPMPLPRRQEGGEPGPSSGRGPSTSGLPIPPAPLSAYSQTYPPPPPLSRLDHPSFPAPFPAPSLAPFPAPTPTPTEITSFDFAAMFASNNGAILPYDSGESAPQRHFGQFGRGRYEGGGGEGEGRREGER